VAPDDPKALADALEQLASVPAKVEAIGRRARELSIAKYTWRRAVADTFAEIEKLQAARGRAAGGRAAL
jgi:glycosyltransferase involved in cell wall biosynthesis